MTEPTNEDIPDVDDADTLNVDVDVDTLDDFEPVNPGHYLADEPTEETQDDEA
jgi:hypothetical protein